MAINRAQGAMLQHPNVDPTTLNSMALLNRQFVSRQPQMMVSQQPQQPIPAPAPVAPPPSQNPDLKIQIPNSILQSQSKQKNQDDAYVPSKRVRKQKREKASQSGGSSSRTLYQFSTPPGFVTPNISESLNALSNSSFKKFISLFRDYIVGETRDEKSQDFEKTIYNVYFSSVPINKDIIGYYLDTIKSDSKLLDWIDSPPIPSVLCRYPQMKPKIVCTKTQRGQYDFRIPITSMESSVIVIGTFVNPFTGQVIDTTVPITVNNRDHCPFTYGESQKRFYILHSGSCPNKPLRILFGESVEKSFAFFIIQVCFQKSEDTIMREISARFDPYTIHRNLPERPVMNKICLCPPFPLGRYVDNLLSNGFFQCPTCQRQVNINDLCISRTPVDSFQEINGHPNRSLLADSLCFVIRPLENGSHWAEVVFEEGVRNHHPAFYEDEGDQTPARDAGDEYRSDFLNSATSEYQ